MKTVQRTKQVSEPIQEGRQHRYYCRLCAEPLPSGSRELFHLDCLKADKRERMREKRRQERVKFERWFRRERCPECGAKLGKGLESCRQPGQEASCATSQGTPGQREDARSRESTQDEREGDPEVAAPAPPLVGFDPRPADSLEQFEVVCARARVRHRQFQGRGM